MIAHRSTLERLSALALPREERELILADLQEESIGRPGRGRTWRVLQALRIGGRFHAECYRDPDDRLRIAVLCFAATCPLWLIPLATASYLPGGIEYFADVLGRVVVRFWSASHITSAIAAGIIAGRLGLVPEHVARSRWHIAIAGAAALLAWYGPGAGALAAALLLASACLGDRARRAHSDDTPPGSGAYPSMQ